MDRKRLTNILFIIIIALAFSFAGMMVGFILGLITLLSHHSSVPFFMMCLISSTVFNVLWITFDHLYDKWQTLEKDEKEVEEDDDEEL